MGNKKKKKTPPLLKREKKKNKQAASRESRAEKKKEKNGKRIYVVIDATKAAHPRIARCLLLCKDDPRGYRRSRSRWNLQTKTTKAPFDRELSSLAHQGLFRLDCPFLLLSRLDRSNATGTPERRKRSGLDVGQRQHYEE